jgi:hypothetical protein
MFHILHLHFTFTDSIYRPPCVLSSLSQLWGCVDCMNLVLQPTQAGQETFKQYVSLPEEAVVPPTNPSVNEPISFGLAKVARVVSAASMEEAVAARSLVAAAECAVESAVECVVRLETELNVAKQRVDEASKAKRKADSDLESTKRVLQKKQEMAVAMEQKAKKDSADYAEILEQGKAEVMNRLKSALGTV